MRVPVVWTGTETCFPSGAALRRETMQVGQIHNNFLTYFRSLKCEIYCPPPDAVGQQKQLLKTDLKRCPNLTVC